MEAGAARLEGLLGPVPSNSEVRAAPQKSLPLQPPAWGSILQPVSGFDLVD
jgi:hypothetical protein